MEDDDDDDDVISLLHSHLSLHPSIYLTRPPSIAPVIRSPPSFDSTKGSSKHFMVYSGCKKKTQNFSDYGRASWCSHAAKATPA